MKVYSRLSTNGKPYTIVLWDSIKKYNLADLDNVNWHKFKEGDVLHGFLDYPIGTVAKITGNKILIV